MDSSKDDWYWDSLFSIAVEGGRWEAVVRWFYMLGMVGGGGVVVLSTGRWVQAGHMIADSKKLG